MHSGANLQTLVNSPAKLHHCNLSGTNFLTASTEALLKSSQAVSWRDKSIILNCLSWDTGSQKPYGICIWLPCQNHSNYFKSIHAVICIVFPHRKTKEIAGTSPRGHVELKLRNYRFAITDRTKRNSQSSALVLMGTLSSDENC